MTELRFTRSALRWIGVLDLATFLTAVGVWGQNLARNATRQTLASSSVLLLLTPGYVAQGILAYLFASGGIHSAEEFDWVAAPVSLIFYFLVGARIFCVRRKE